MKLTNRKFSTLKTYGLAILLFGCTLFLSVLLNKGIIKQYFPFTAIILLTIVTWFLYKREQQSLNSIGLNLKLKNLALLPLGLLIGSIAFLIAKYLRALYLDETFNVSLEINYNNILYALYAILPTVAVEEFLFRGYLFKKTIEISSVTRANIIFSILFMLIHVLDENVLKNPGAIILLTISIPVGHLLFATALLKSKSLFLPIGIHLGNNWATRHLVTTNNDGESIFYVTNNVGFNTWSSFILFVLLWNSFFLLVTYVIWKWNSKKSF
ncbi:CPBP family intramembrane glutamic endopeptidase [Pseudotenacibaculum sp. MALMAid0570]|uniref:CPBP family intramembrane glutamic endopeptidase n=1 Tax=Pseudotenacibaculum sp. MALMAid0570 TaxID=3143938 RepID=UPI0032DE4F57